MLHMLLMIHINCKADYIRQLKKLLLLNLTDVVKSPDMLLSKMYRN